MTTFQTDVRKLPLETPKGFEFTEPFVSTNGEDALAFPRGAWERESVDTVIASVVCEVPLLDSAYKRDSKSGTIYPDLERLLRRFLPDYVGQADAPRNDWFSFACHPRMSRFWILLMSGIRKAEL